VVILRRVCGEVDRAFESRDGSASYTARPSKREVHCCVLQVCAALCHAWWWEVLLGSLRKWIGDGVTLQAGTGRELGGRNLYEVVNRVSLDFMCRLGAQLIDSAGGS
jgi:hypothetical protein